MKIDGNAIRPGNIIEHQGRLLVAIKIQHVQPGKGGAYLQVELKDIRDGTKMNERFRSSETVERVRLDQKDYQFLFADGDHYTFMDTETLRADRDQRRPDRRGSGVPAGRHDGDRSSSSRTSRSASALPETVSSWQITEADAVVKGQTASSSYKPAMLENGVRVMVPPHIETGTRDRGQHRRPEATSSGRRTDPVRWPAAPPLINVMAAAADKAGPRPDPRLRRGRAPPGQPQGPHGFRLRRRPARPRTHPAGGTCTRARPDYGFLLEEGGRSRRPGQAARWIVDPLDGTTNFMHWPAPFLHLDRPCQAIKRGRSPASSTTR